MSLVILPSNFSLFSITSIATGCVYPNNFKEKEGMKYLQILKICYEHTKADPEIRNMLRIKWTYWTAKNILTQWLTWKLTWWQKWHRSHTNICHSKKKRVWVFSSDQIWKRSLFCIIIMFFFILLLSL